MEYNGINMKAWPRGKSIFVTLGESETIQVKVDVFSRLVYFDKTWLDL
jgi:hypothetical protein